MTQQKPEADLSVRAFGFWLLASLLISTALSVCARCAVLAVLCSLLCSLLADVLCARCCRSCVSLISLNSSSELGAKPWKESTSSSLEQYSSSTSHSCTPELAA